MSEGAPVEPQGRILVVEDDLSILIGLSMGLKAEGYEVVQAQDGKSALEKAVDAPPDLIVLDIMLPAMNGFEVLEELRRRGSRVPVVVLSAKAQESDKILGLDLGADDYVVKPFGLHELLARIRAVLRRRKRDEATQVQVGSAVVDLAAKTVTRDGAQLELTAQEFRLLALFVTNPGKTFSREELLSGAWGFGYEGTARTVDNFVAQLRQKLEAEPERPRSFITIRGLGYRFDG